MFHHSELGEHADKFPRDAKGHVPEPHDHWRDMHFDHGEKDPDAEGISDEERQRRMEYLDKQWWPQILSQTSAEKARLDALAGGNPIKRWQEAVTQPPAQTESAEVEEID